MSFKHPLEMRQRIARNRNQRYRLDPAYRLSRINETRRRAGVPELTTLAELPRVRIPVDG